MFPISEGFLSFENAKFPFGLPKAFEGHCQEGDNIVVHSLKDIQDLDRDQIPCLMSTGQAPPAVPRGPTSGVTANIFNTEILNFGSHAFWRGKFFTKTLCYDDGYAVEKPIMFNFMGPNGLPFFPAIPTIGPLSISDNDLREGEPSLGHEDYLIVDYGGNFGEYCPQKLEADGVLPWNGTNVAGLDNRTPINNILDLAQIVGYTESGSAIMLGRTLLLNEADGLYDTIAYFAIVSADPELEGVVAPVPVPETFHYSQPGVLDTVKVLLESQFASFAADPSKWWLGVLRGQNRDSFDESFKASVIGQLFNGLKEIPSNFYGKRSFNPLTSLFGMF